MSEPWLLRSPVAGGGEGGGRVPMPDAPAVVEYWVYLRERRQGGRTDHTQEAMDVAEQMRAWREKNRP